MEVSMKLEDWKVVTNTKTKQPEIRGKYAIFNGQKKIADEDFNTEYNDETKIPFSGELMQKIKGLEKEIAAEIEGMMA